ncbi:MAG TPA: DUF4232 domain-containing protein [Jatrophihabitans sp.]|nr:DUF4232 domain-containing protein [Jatrophihabitans sp.]
MLIRLAAAGAAVLLLAGCTQQPQSAPATPSPATSSAVSSSAASPTRTPISATTPFSPPPPTTITPARPSVTPTPSIEPGGCPTSALTVRALRGSGAAGHEFAFVQFTNTSTSACSLTGYPGVLLLLGGQPLGQPAVRSGEPIHTVRIPPGTSVSANLVDDSSCNAAISDSVQVIPPNRTDRIVLKLALRGCRLTVGPVTAS